MNIRDPLRQQSHELAKIKSPPFIRELNFQRQSLGKHKFKGMEMTTSINLRKWRILCSLCTLLSAFSTHQLAFAQCCGGNAMGGFTGEMVDYSFAPGQIIEGDSIYLTVNLPDAASLKVNGDPTISLGPTRYFVVRGLDPTKTYSFDFIAESLNPAGVALLEKKSLKLRPGANEIVTLKPVKRKVPRPAADASATDEEKKTNADEDSKEKDTSAQTNSQNSPSRKARQI